ncbi:sacsin N-terminal ATP-binding-like domain-containing protein [Hymenobacter crusticola]|uniref:Protein NO VEIN C-terminal domain-containing protein n=1 Tax=Hymenobacter crusticola TaxID=1770526 RepID=A0A243W5V0_9BACT|nr:hypothetical protein [Hymenobacter crusticola]OUJ69074.1 hypothetical protein BXP70_27060 [Hymenobacter crusticola]
MAFEGFEEDFEQEDKEQQAVAAAKRIIQIIKEAREKPEQSQRRWIWELMQNAKDERPDTGVLIRVERTTDRLTFAHNGRPFQLKHQISLIKGSSSKSVGTPDQGITGKFGTGFISTHILSKQVEVGGIVAHKGAYGQFKLTLDRTGETPKELVQKMLALEAEAKALPHTSGFTVLENYTLGRLPHDTTFSYILESERQQEAAEYGLKDLVHTLPYTLVNLYNQIGQVEIRDSLNGIEKVYQCTLLELSAGLVKAYQVTITDSDPTRNLVRTILQYDAGAIKLLAEVEETEEGTYALKEATAPMPLLYWDFPLIGTEDFYFPFVLNGQPFHPTQPRDGLELNAAEEHTVIHNRRLLEEAQQAALAFSEWLLEKKTRNTYFLATTHLPAPLLAGKDAQNAREWYRALQEQWRAKLLDLKLVETEVGESVQLRKARIPRLDAAHATRKDHEALWNLAAPLLGLGVVPRRDLLKKWLDVLGSGEEAKSWQMNLWVSQSDLLEEVAKATNLEGLLVAETMEDRLAWLNQLYALVIEHKGLELLNKHAVIPNHQGDFCLLSKLRQEDKDDQVPSPVLDILALAGRDWRPTQIHAQIMLPLLPQDQVRGLKKASDELREVLNKDLTARVHGVLSPGFFRHWGRQVAQQILAAILRLEGPGSDAKSFKSQLLPLAQVLLKLDQPAQPVVRLGEFDFKPATYLMVLLINQNLSAAATLKGLTTELGYEGKQQAVRWLDTYLTLLAGSKEYGDLLNEGALVPNRLDELKPWNTLLDYGSVTQPLDLELLHILAALDPSKNKLPVLVGDGIAIKRGDPYVYTFEQLGKEFIPLLEEVQRKGTYRDHTTSLSDFVKWCSKKPELAKAYLRDLLDAGINHRVSYMLMELNGGTGYIMELAKKPDALPGLMEIVDSGVDVDQLVAISKTGVNMDQLLAIAHLAADDTALMERFLSLDKQRKDDFANFRHMQRIGAAMEKVFRAALEQAGVTAEVDREKDEAKAEIRYKGIGSYDFAIVNSSEPQKRFYIELKSYLKMDNPQPIRMAVSQAREAATGTVPFALCVVGREGSSDHVSIEDIEANLLYVKGLAIHLYPIVQEITELERLQQQSNDVWLDVPDITASKVRLSHAFIRRKPSTFSDLIKDITIALH